MVRRILGSISSYMPSLTGEQDTNRDSDTQDNLHIDLLTDILGEICISNQYLRRISRSLEAQVEVSTEQGIQLKSLAQGISAQTDIYQQYILAITSAASAPIAAHTVPQAVPSSPTKPTRLCESQINGAVDPNT